MNIKILAEVIIDFTALIICGIIITSLIGLLTYTMWQDLTFRYAIFLLIGAMLGMWSLSKMRIK